MRAAASGSAASRAASSAAPAAAARIGDPALPVEEGQALPPGDAAATWRGGGAAPLEAFELQER